MLDLLAEANAWIEDNLLALDSAITQSLKAALEKLIDLGHHVSVGGVLLHGLRSSAHMHADVAGPGFGDQFPHSGVLPIGMDVIDDTGSGCQGLPGHPNFHCVNRNWNVQLAREL